MQNLWNDVPGSVRFRLLSRKRRSDPFRPEEGREPAPNRQSMSRSWMLSRRLVKVRSLALAMALECPRNVQSKAGTRFLRDPRKKPEVKVRHLDSEHFVPRASSPFACGGVSL